MFFSVVQNKGESFWTFFVNCIGHNPDLKLMINIVVKLPSKPFLLDLHAYTPTHCPVIQTTAINCRCIYAMPGFVEKSIFTSLSVYFLQHSIIWWSRIVLFQIVAELVCWPILSNSGRSLFIVLHDMLHFLLYWLRHHSWNCLKSLRCKFSILCFMLYLSKQTFYALKHIMHIA